MACLGVVELISSLAAWSWPQPKLFLLYLFLALLCSLLRLKISDTNSPPLSANVPIILLSILQLSLHEAVIVGAAGAIAQGILNRRTRSLRLHFVLGVGVAATAIAMADFIYGTLIPSSIQSPAVRLVGASLALFFANTFPVALAGRGYKHLRLGQYWKDSSSWLVPYYLVSAAIAGAANAAAVSGISTQMMLLVMPAIYLAWRYYRIQKSTMEMREKTAADTAALHLRTIEGLALAVEAKDSLSIRGHLRRVRAYALRIARDLGLAGDELEALQAGALLHDIGKLAVPEYILTKPGKLTPQEFARMKVHPIVGAEIVEQVQFPYAVAPIVRSHHEKWDGTGYPFGLKGQDIPIGARILSAADYLDALTSDREYRRALPFGEAMALLEAESGKGLDPAVVDALARCRPDLEKIAQAGDDAGVVLSKDVVVERGSAPDAGLDLWALTGVGGDFVNSIAAAGREQQQLLALTHGLGSSLDLKTILDQVETGLRELIPHDAMAIFLPQGDMLVMAHSGGEHKARVSREVRAGEGLVGWVAQNQQPIVNGNATVERGSPGGSEDGLQAALGVPLMLNGGLAGVLACYRRQRDSFTSDHLRILSSVAPRIGTAIENALKVKELEERSSVDLITGLPTTAPMMKALEVELIRAKREDQSLGVAVVEFAGLNSLRTQASGYEADQVLRDAASFLKTSCREYDHVCRTGEEKFGIIFPGMKRDTLIHKLEQLYAGVASQFPQAIDDGTVRVGVGWAVYPDDADTPKLLVAIAEGRHEMAGDDTIHNLLALDAHNQRDPAPGDEKRDSGLEVQSVPAARDRRGS